LDSAARGQSGGYGVQRFVSKFAIAAAATLVASTGIAAAQTAARQLVRIQDFPGVGNLHTRVAIEQGYCDKHNITCELKMIPSSPLGLQALVSGSIDVSMASIEPVIQAAIKGAEVRVVGGNLADNPFFLVFGDLLKTPNLAKGYPDLMLDLKGKKIGVTARGSASEFQFKDLLIGAGLKSDDVTFVAVGAPNTAYPAVVERQVDAALTFEPSGAMCEVLKTCKVVLSLARDEGPPSLKGLNGAATVFVVRSGQIGKQTETSEAFMKAMQDADAFIHETENRAQVEKITLKYFKLDVPDSAAVVRVAVDRYLPYYRFNITREAAQKAADYLLKTGQIDKPFDISKLFAPK
jgi:NitT/TauT family transport system substrate-binding protein